MTALGLVGESRPCICRYCRKPAVETELRWRTSDGSRGTIWRVEPHRCAETALSPLVCFDGEEDQFVWPDEHEEGGFGA